MQHYTYCRDKLAKHHIEPVLLLFIFFFFTFFFGECMVFDLKKKVRFNKNLTMKKKIKLTKKGLRLADYLWAIGVVMTRQNRIPQEGNATESEIALIPGWDMWYVFVLLFLFCICMF